MAILDKRIAFQIRNFERALVGYQHKEPLARYLTRYYKENKQMGSSDRRMTSRFCYTYFRLGNAFTNWDPIERLVIAEFLCTNDSDLVRHVNPELAGYIQETTDQKIKVLLDKYNFRMEDVFPLIDHVSDQVSINAFVKSHWVQPRLFIRVQHGAEELVTANLIRNNIHFEKLSGATYALPNGVNLQQLAKISGKYEVQDLSSQRTLDYFPIKSNETWWDVCAGSGGKALLLLDNFPDLNLLVSDVRPSILRNLDERFEIAGVKKHYRKKILDLSKSVEHIMHGERFDGLLLDVPCSGSGTWGRTPEMMQQFSIGKLESYAQLQKQIVSNAIPYLKIGGTLVYLTCSVYREENEDVVAFIQEEFKLQLQECSLIKGYTNQADSMFAARFIKVV